MLVNVLKFLDEKNLTLVMYSVNKISRKFNFDNQIIEMLYKNVQHKFHDYKTKNQITIL